MKTLGLRLVPREISRAPPPKKRAAAVYLSREWRQFMAELLEQRGRRCEECGRENCRIFGDHIRELQDGGAVFDPNNVQLLCGSCHTAKTAAVRAERTAIHYQRKGE